MNVVPFPDNTDPESEPERADPTGVLAIVEALVSSLIDTLGDMTVGDALEELAKMPMKTFLGELFGGLTSDDPPAADTP